MHIATRISAKGKPAVMATVCKATRPPPAKRTAATTPSVRAQNTRCATGGSRFPPAVMMSITNEPESEDVTKKTNTRTILSIDVIVAKG